MSDWIRSSISIIAGCGEANNMARRMLYDLVEDMHFSQPTEHLDTFVDDMRQFDSDPDEHRLARRAAATTGRLLEIRDVKNC